ncbi:MAG TPA: M18 family aminopeptidase [Rectinemataceae bacterium]|nr:M18 family aminopeptidase [Rectinemataceae bacterium]
MDQSIDKLRDFIDASPTAWQAVDSIAARLSAAGGTRLDEREPWKLEPGLLYWVERSGSGLIAFKPGLRSPAEEGFAVAGAHTDSPGLKLRLEKRLGARGMERCAIEVYGSPILSTWLDRPLAVAGRLVLKGEGGLSTRLVSIDRPVGIVPNLAIHLNRDVNKGYEYNAQTQLPVLIASDPGRGGGGVAVLPGASGKASGEAIDGLAGAGSRDPESFGDESASAIVKILGSELDVEPTSIVSADLFFVDAQKTSLIGSDLINGYRLDNLLGCHAVLEALVGSKNAAHGQVAAFFDSEEIGSRTRMGADSSFLRDILARITSLSGSTTEGFHRALASSFSVSVDVAQAWHPGWPEKFDETFSPLLNGGPAVKVNANHRYATDALSEARFRGFCETAGVPCQKFQTRADMSPGSTIGPISAALSGMATVDVGSPLLSMHSLRETAGTRDQAMMTAALAVHFAVSPKGGV